MASPHEVERWSPLKAWLYSLFYGNPKSNRAVVEHAALGPGDRFLDIGCGPGAALAHAAATGASVAGVDPSPAMVERASRRVPMAEVKVGSAEAIPFPDDSFSAVITISAFHHWADRAAGLEECRRVLEPGGKVYVVEGALRDGKDGHGLDTRGAEVLAAKLIELGFTDTDTDELKTGWRHSYFVVSGVAP